MPKLKVRRALARSRSQPSGVQRGIEPEPVEAPLQLVGGPAGRGGDHGQQRRPVPVGAVGRLAAVQRLQGLDGREQGVVPGRQQVRLHVAQAGLGPVGVGHRAGRRLQLAVAVGVEERLVAVAEVPRGVAATPEDGRPQVLAGHEPGGQHEPGQGGRAGLVLAADRVQPGQLGRVADGEPEAAQVADLAGREAAAQGRLPGGQRSRLEAAKALVVQPDLGGRGRVVEGQRGHAHPVPASPAAQSTSARSRRPSGVVGVAKVSS